MLRGVVSDSCDVHSGGAMWSFQDADSGYYDVGFGYAQWWYHDGYLQWWTGGGCDCVLPLDHDAGWQLCCDEDSAHEIHCDAELRLSCGADFGLELLLHYGTGLGAVGS